MKIEDIQYGLELGGAITSKKEALWMAWRSWVETYQKHPDRKPAWVFHYVGRCSCCEFNNKMHKSEDFVDCRYCAMLEVWGQYHDIDQPCIEEGSPFFNHWIGFGGKKEASIIADAALKLLEKECYR